MNRNLLWRGILILGILAGAVAAGTPPKEKISLGLDLQGGMHLVLQVHTEDALRAETDSDMGVLLQQAQEKDKSLSSLRGKRTGDTSFEVTALTPQARDILSEAASRYLSGYSADSETGRMVFTMKADYADNIRAMSVTQAKQTIDNRVNAFGVAEPVIQETSGHRILVQLPGVDDYPAAEFALHWVNFLTPPVEAMRAVLFFGDLPAAADTIYTAVTAAVALVVGAWVFSRSDDRIATEV